MKEKEDGAISRSGADSACMCSRGSDRMSAGRRPWACAGRTAKLLRQTDSEKRSNLKGRRKIHDSLSWQRSPEIFNYPPEIRSFLLVLRSDRVPCVSSQTWRYFHTLTQGKIHLDRRRPALWNFYISLSPLFLPEASPPAQWEWNSGCIHRLTV